MKRFLLAFAFVLLMNTVVAAQATTITNVIAEDVDNWGNGADLQISFEASDSANERRVLVAKADTMLDLETAMAAENYVEVSADSGAVEVTLPDDVDDIDGDPIVEGVAYQVYILSLGSEMDELSAPSPEVTLANEAVVFTLVEELDAGAGGLETDAEGNIYFADFGSPELSPGTRVYKITPDGEVSLFLEGHDLEVATGNTFDPDGNYYQSSFRTNRVIRVTPDGEISTFVEEGMNSPVGIIYHPDGNFYVANCGNATIQAITPEGESTRLAIDVLFGCANGITVDDNGLMYIANFSNANVMTVTTDGEVDFFAQLPGRNNAHLVYHDGLLYAAARGEHQIYTITLDGQVELFAGTGELGGTDGPALEASFTLPNDLAFSPDGRILYINDVASETDTVNYPGRVRGIIMPR